MAKKRKEADVEAENGEELLKLDFSDEEERQEIQASRKKLLAAKTLLQELSTHPHDIDVSNSGSEEVDAKSLDKSLISSRILKATAQAQGRRIYDFLAARIDFRQQDVGKGCSHFRGSPISLAISPDARYVFSGWSTGAVRKYDRRLGRVINHFLPTLQNEKKKGAVVVSPVTALALSPSGSYLAVGRKDGRIDLYDAVSHRPGSVSQGVFSHRGSITALCFGPEDTRLYSSASLDRTIKVWQISQQEVSSRFLLSFIDTLYGHQDAVPSLASVSEDRCLSVGGRDRTARLWKIVEESQLVFRSSPEQDGDELVCVAPLNDSAFVTGGIGSVAVWSHGRKKPLFRLSLSNKTDDKIGGKTDESVISLATLPGSDLVAVGTDLGRLCIYQYLPESQELSFLYQIHSQKSNNDEEEDDELMGLVNSLAWAFDEGTNCLTLAVAYGREGRLDRTRVTCAAPRVYTFSWSIIH